MITHREAMMGLNAAQLSAVEHIEGPVLVIAGPGTGKTQLLTTRVAHILEKTDTLPENILCLTFTESATHTMRDRLVSLIGQAAYSVTISTYHGFGSDIIRRYPDYFTEFGETQPVDDLGIDTIFREILGRLPYSNPLKYAGNYLNDVKSLVSNAKKALLTPDDMRNVADRNEEFINNAQPMLTNQLGEIFRIDKKAVPAFEKLAIDLQKAKAGEPLRGITPISQLFLEDLNQALKEVSAIKKTTPLTKWKNTWLAKNEAGQFVVDGRQTCRRLRAAADVYAFYLQELAARNLFDYDDMILRAVGMLQANDDLRLTLQERYQYLMLDEFQDTNDAQLRLINLLMDNPVNEGRPNVLAVGDDDQAIYAFQGANYSHMLEFQKMYRDVLLIPLTENYRSHADILHVARGIAGQIEERLHHHFPQIEKTLTAIGKGLPKTAVIERREAKSDIAQFAWTAKRIKQLIDSGVSASEIAVLAPQHKHLEPLVAFLHQEGLPVHYEKRENVLEDPAINQLLRMSELVLSLNSGNHARANSLWAEVLSYSFWDLPTSLIWQLSWQANDTDEHWTDVLLKNEVLGPLALFFIRLSLMAGTETLETILDYLIGVAPLDLHEPGPGNFRSPFYEFYFGRALEIANDSKVEGIDQPSTFGSFWQLLTNLTVLRSKLRIYRADDSEPLSLSDLLSFVDAHNAARIKILNTNPHQEASEAVQLMTAYKAKGQEFLAVFVIACSDEVWGGKTRTNTSRISLPQNLQFIRYGGVSDDERLRLFYVAITRTKSQLFLVNYTSNYAGKAMTRLRYLNESPNEAGTVQSPLLPKSRQAVLMAGDGQSSPTSELAVYWQHRHEAALTSEAFTALIKGRLEQFQLSPTHTIDFVNLVNAGPAYFFINTILRFPKSPTTNGQYGNAIHETLEWIHIYNKRHQALPSLRKILAFFEKHLKNKRLSKQDTALLLERGREALNSYITHRAHTVSAANECEYSFRHEGIFIGKAHMSGKIDKLIIDKSQKTITIVDYKTGKSYQRWQRDPKLHFYRQQLYLYKLLVEQSNKFAGYKVVDAYIEFVEPDEDGQIQELHLVFNGGEMDRIKKLTASIWQHIQTINLPNIGIYNPDLAGIESFENDLILGTGN